MPFTTLIADDEPLAREGLRLLLSSDPEISEVYEAKDGREAVDVIERLRPDLVFLDVQMPELDGFAVAKHIGERMPAVVFVTAHDRYAIQAFEISAVDYLLKPVSEDRFAKALDRAKSHLKTNSVEEAGRRILALLANISAPERHLKRLAVRSGGKTAIVDVADIDWIEAAENYIQIHAGGSRYLLHVTMNTLEKSLDASVFLRIHRSTIVNVTRIRELQPLVHGEFVLTLQSGDRLQSGRSYSARVRSLTVNPF